MSTATLGTNTSPKDVSDSDNNRGHQSPIHESLPIGRKLTNGFVTVLVTVAFALAMIPLVTVLVTVISNGYLRTTWEFLVSDMVGMFGGKVGGGIAHALVGTTLVTLWATLISAPIGIFTAIYLVEYGNNGLLSKATTFFVDVMTGIPRSLLVCSPPRSSCCTTPPIEQASSARSPCRC